MLSNIFKLLIVLLLLISIQVTFDYRADDFPNRNFPRTSQIGWVADEVEKVFPELVTTDESGFRGVAYARSCAVIAQAVKEMRDEYRGMLAEIMQQINELKTENNDILSKLAV